MARQNEEDALDAELKWLCKGAEHISLRCKVAELKMYRSCRTAAICEQSFAHFEYLIYVHWPGAASASTLQSHSQWQEPIKVRRRWADITAFHRALQTEVVYDAQNNIKHTDMLLPALPKEDDVHEWVSATGAAGDVRTLSRTDHFRYLPHAEAHLAKEALRDRHDHLTRRVNHFLKSTCKILNGLPSNLLVRCVGVRRFLAPDMVETSLTGPFLGPQPLNMKGARPESAKPADGKRALDVADARASTFGTFSRDSGLTRPSTAGAVVESVKATITDERRPTSSQKKVARPESSPAHLTRAPVRGATEDENAVLSKTGKSHHLMMFRAMPPDEAGCEGAYLWQHRQEQKHLRHKANMSRSRSIGAVGERKRLTMRDLQRPSIFSTPVSPKSPWSVASPDSAAGINSRGNASSRLKAALLRSSSFGNTDIGRQEKQLRIMYEKMKSSFWERTHREICEGFRAVLFGRPGAGGNDRKSYRGVKKIRRQAISNAGANEAVAIKLGSPQQVHDLFKMYRSLVLKDKDNRCKPKSNAAGEVHEESTLDALLREQEMPDEKEQEMLSPVRWETLLAWVDNERSYAVSIADQKHCDKLSQSLVRMQEEMSWQVPRISLPMMMQLIWPHAGLADIGQMLSWIANAELELHREPTPPPLNEKGLRQLLDLFKLLDVDGSGKISAEELAESKGQILDANVVRAVVGDEDLTTNEFLEYMCEDGYRPTETSTHAFRDGQELRLEKWTDVEWEGWVRVQGRSDEMAKHYQWLKNLKAEVVWWRQRGSTKETAQASSGSPSPGAPTNLKTAVGTMRSRLHTSLSMVRVVTSRSGHNQNEVDEEPTSPAESVIRIDRIRKEADADMKRQSSMKLNVDEMMQT